MATPLTFEVLGRDRGAKAMFDQLAKSMSTADKASDELAASQRALAAAEAKAADAAGAVRVAEAKLDGVRKSAKATAAQRLQAEENLSRVQRRLSMAQTDVTASSRRLKVAQEQVAAAISHAGKEAEQSRGHLRRAMGGLHAFGSAGVNATGKMVGGFKAVGVGAAGVGVAIAAAAAAPVLFGLKVAAANEQAEIAFTTMLGSAKRAKSFLEDLKKFAAATPFEFPELQSAASSLISVGVNAKNVIPIMRTLGNITSGMGTGSEGIQRATVAIQQMQAAGRITAEDLNQLRDAGIPLNSLFQGMAKHSEHSAKKLGEMSREGKLGNKELKALMLTLQSGEGFERFNGLMDKQSKSLTGMISTLKDTFGQGMADALQGAIPFLKDGINRITDLMGRFFGWAQTHQEDMVDGFVDVGDGIFGIAEAFLHLDSAGLKAFGDISTGLGNFLKGLSRLPGMHGLAKIGDDLINVGGNARIVAGTIDTKMLPAIQDAHAKWTKFGNDQRTAAAMRDGNARIQKALEATRESIKKNGRTLDIHSEQGARNRRALRNLAEENIRYVRRLEDTGASTKKVDRATENARQSFIKTAVRMGASRQQAGRLADSFGLLDRRINALNSKRVSINFSTNAFKVAGTKFHVNLSSPSSAGRAASGGFIKGPGTPTSDSIPYMLSNGEFVVRASETKKHRQLLEAINSGKERHMATGGYVHPDVGRFPVHAMGIPPAAQSYTNRFAQGAANQLGKALAKGIENSFVGPGGGITGAAGGRVRYKGGTFTRLFARNLELIQRAAHVSMRVFQGGFRPRTSYSGTSHAGDAVDFQVNYALGRAFRKYVGAAGDRTGLGNWSPHIHAVPSPSHGRAGGSAIWQYRDYVRRGGARQSMRSPWGLSRGGTMVNPSTARLSEFGPEKVLTPAQTRSFDRMVRVMDSSGGAANTYITINAPNYVGSRDELRQTLVDMNRRGQLEVIKR